MVTEKSQLLENTIRNISNFILNLSESGDFFTIKCLDYTIEDCTCKHIFRKTSFGHLIVNIVMTDNIVNSFGSNTYSIDIHNEKQLKIFLKDILTEYIYKDLQWTCFNEYNNLIKLV